jgi:dihydrofolate reductase
VRDLIVTENVTLEGVVEASEGWFTPYQGDDIGAVNRAHMAAADAVLLGRVTYEEFAGFWPLQTADTTGVTDYLNRTAKYVVSSSLTKADWQNTTILRGPIAEEIAALKRLPGKDIVATGSITLVRALLRAGLVDVYRLFIHPLVLGRGRRIFGDGFDRPLRLAETQTFQSGVVLLTYRTAEAAIEPAESR